MFNALYDITFITICKLFITTVRCIHSLKRFLYEEVCIIIRIFTGFTFLMNWTPFRELWIRNVEEETTFFWNLKRDNKKLTLDFLIPLYFLSIFYMRFCLVCTQTRYLRKFQNSLPYYETINVRYTLVQSILA